MSKRRCLDCPTLIESGRSRCTSCARKRDAGRGRRQARGYDTNYDQAHREYQRRMDAGETFDCWRCPELGRPAHQVDPRPGRWHLGHDLHDRTILRGPQCPASNLGDAGRGPMSHVT